MDVQQMVTLRVTAGDKNTQDCFIILNLNLSVPSKAVIADPVTKYNFCLLIFIFISRLCLFSFQILSRVRKAPTDQTCRHSLTRWVPGMKF